MIPYSFAGSSGFSGRYRVGREDVFRLYAAGVCPVHRWNARTKFETVE